MPRSNSGLHKSAAWLHSRRVVLKRTLEEMSKEAGVSAEMISRSLKKHGLK